jgi:ABC-type transport system substrate-binding protein
MASETVIGLARRVDGIRFAPQRPTKVKGIHEAIRPIEVVPEEPLPPFPSPPWPALAGRRRRLLAASGAALLLAAGGLFLWRSSQPSPVALLPGNSLGLIDVGTNRLVADVPLGGNPSGVAVGGGSVWVASQADNHVRQVPLGGASARPYPVGSDPGGVAFGFGSAWVADSGEALLSRINPTTGVVTAIHVGNGPVGVTTGAGMVWVSNSLDGTVTRVDPTDPTHRRKTFAVSGDPTAIAYGHGAVWVASGEQVLEITPDTGEVAHHFPDTAGPVALAVGDGGVWVANTDGSVWRIDDNPNHADFGNPNILKEAGGEPSSLAVAPGEVWVGSRITGTLTHINPRTGKVSRLRIRSDPAGIAVSGRRVWVAAGATAHSHRGGTLRVAWTLGHRFDPIDPAIAYTGTAWQVLSMTNDGLLTFRRVAGAGGTQLVADLATRIPTPTDGGKTYTFQLRRGIHYSTGELVSPIDVRASIERLFTAGSPNPGYYTGIIGADSCTVKRCDLHQGITVDQAASTVTFHLRRPDPDFLDKLGLPFADVLPAETPSHGERRVPATGPYQTAVYSPTAGFVLIRNPHFRQWSRDAQPDGYPDRIAIKLHFVQSSAAENRDSLHDLHGIEQGRLDWGAGVLPSQITRVEAQYPTLIHQNPVMTTVGLFLNTRVPPFNSLDARRAVNYATNRQLTRRLAAASGGVGEITCQILPPVSPAYRPYCPYTSEPNADGQWTRPNLSKAKKLVRASRTQGTRVKLWMWRPFQPWGRYFARLLTSLGYPTRIKWLPTDVDPREEDSGTHAQIGFVDWTPDYPTPSALLRGLFSCNAFKPYSPTNANLSEWCDPGVDAQMRRAGGLQTAGRLGAANAVWASVDRAITDQAPSVPLITLTNADLVSKRVGNYTSNPYWGVLIDQMWVR